MFSEEEAVALYLRLTYNSAKGRPVCRHGAVSTPSGVGPPGEVFFPCLGTSISKSSEATLFFPQGGNFGKTSLTILLHGDSNSPGQDVQCLKLCFSVLPFVFPEGT